MKNEYLYKKLKYELALSYLYNTNKYRHTNRQILWNICQYFNIEFTNQLYNTISTFAYCFCIKLRRDTYFLYCNEVMLTRYANTHNINIYDMKEHKLINSV